MISDSLLSPCRCDFITSTSGCLSTLCPLAAAHNIRTPHNCHHLHTMPGLTIRPMTTAAPPRTSAWKSASMRTTRLAVHGTLLPFGTRGCGRQQLSWNAWLKTRDVMCRSNLFYLEVDHTCATLPLCALAGPLKRCRRMRVHKCCTNVKAVDRFELHTHTHTHTVTPRRWSSPPVWHAMMST
jgi:hypothetical protein